MHCNAAITSLLQRVAALSVLHEDGTLPFQPDDITVSRLCGQVRDLLPMQALSDDEIIIIALLHSGKQWVHAVRPTRSNVPHVLTSLREKGIVEVESLPEEIIEDTLIPPIVHLTLDVFTAPDCSSIRPDQPLPFASNREYLLSWFHHVKRLHQYRENEHSQHPIHGIASAPSRTVGSSPTETERKYDRDEQELIKRSQIEWEQYPVERVVHQLGLHPEERRILLFVLMTELNDDHCTTQDLLYLTSTDTLDGLDRDRLWQADSMLRLYDLISIEESRRSLRLRSVVTMRSSVRRWLATGDGSVSGITDLDDSAPYPNEYAQIEDWIRFGRLWVRLSRLAGANRRNGDDDDDEFDETNMRRPSTHPMLASMKERIERKTEASSKKFPLDILTERYELSEVEKDVLILMIEAVTSGRDLDIDDLTLIMTSDPVERQKLETLLSPDSRLVVNGLVQVTPRRNGSVELALPTSVRNYLLGVSDSFEITTKAILMNDDLLSLVTTDRTLDDLILPNEIMDVLRSSVRSYQTNADAVLRSWGILPSKKDLSEPAHGGSLTCLISGTAGVGKTHLAYCLAGSLGKEILVTDCSRLLSVWVSESEKNVSRLFSTYASIVRNSENFPCLLLNEVDQFWGRRGTGSERSVERMYHQMQNLFLEKLESFEGILLCTTNLVESLDPAFSRRMLVKLTIPMPDTAGRHAIWKLHLKPPVPLAEDVNLERLSEIFQFSGGAIRNCVTVAATEAAIRGDIIKMADLIAACRAEESGAFDTTSTMRNRLVGFCAPDTELLMKEVVPSRQHAQ